MAISASILPIEDRPHSEICAGSQHSSSADLNIEKIITERIRVNKRETWLAGLESGSQVRWDRQACIANTGPSSNPRLRACCLRGSVLIDEDSGILSGYSSSHLQQTAALLLGN